MRPAVPDMRNLAGRAARYLYRRRCPNFVVSFPKSGKTWTKQVLEAYFQNMAEPGRFELDFDRWRPLLPNGRRHRAPAVLFTHAIYRYEDPVQLLKWIELCRTKRVVLQARDPRAIVISYYFQRIRRFGEAREMNLATFLRDETMGIRRIVEYLNLWFQNRHRFRDFLFLRYETNLFDPGQEFKKLLEFLGAGPVNTEALAAAIHRVPDTTRNIEQGGIQLLEHVRAGKPDASLHRGDWQQLDLPGTGEFLSSQDAAYIENQVAALSSEMGYSGPGDQ